MQVREALPPPRGPLQTKGGTQMMALVHTDQNMVIMALVAVTTVALLGWVVYKRFVAKY